MTSSVESRSEETSLSFPHAALATRGLVWYDHASKRQFAILADPAGPNLVAERAAQAAMVRLWESLREYRHLEAAEALLNALSDAHQTVRKANLLPGGQRRADLGLVGITICIVDGDRLLLGMAAPAQALVLQENELYPVPSLASLRPEIPFDDLIIDAAPLGGARFQPQLFTTIIEPGDRLLVCSHGVTRQLVRFAGQYPDQLRTRLVSLLRADPDKATPMLRDLLGPGRDDTLLVFAPGDGPDAHGNPRYYLVKPENSSPTGLELTGSTPKRAPEPDANAAPPPPPRTPVLATNGPNGLVPISSGVLQRHLPQGSPIRQSLRGWLPRGPWERIPLWSVLLLLLVLFAGMGAKIWYNDQQHTRQLVRQYLAEADLQLATLGVSTDNEVVRKQVTAAQAALDKASANGAGAEAIATREASLVLARDRIDNVYRLENVHILGEMPAAVRTTKTPKLLRAGGQVYLLDGAVYRIDSANGQLIELLASGTVVDGITAGAVTGGASDGKTIIVTDGAALFTLQPGDLWSARALGLRDGRQLWNVTSVATFDGAWYLLNGDGGSILKFDAQQPDRLPTDWTQGANRAELTGAVDFAIDGSIYVLTADGNLLTFYRGELTGEMGGEQAAFAKPRAIYAGVDTTYLWVLDEQDGAPALIRIDRGTMRTVTYMLPFGWDTTGGMNALAQIQSLVVLENRGEVLFVTDTGVWSASIPFVE